MKAVYNSKKFKKEMNNIMNYSFGIFRWCSKRKDSILEIFGSQYS